MSGLGLFKKHMNYSPYDHRVHISYASIFYAKITGHLLYYARSPTNDHIMDENKRIDPEKFMRAWFCDYRKMYLEKAIQARKEYKQSRGIFRSKDYRIWQRFLLALRRFKNEEGSFL